MSKKIEVDEDVIKQLMNKVNELTKLVGGPARRNPETTRTRTIVVRYLDDKPVIGFANLGHPSRPVYTYEKPNPLN